ncbi:MAG: hypothetical protein OEQ53_17150, partial [Saprospiraceae bacterium]|nr:hypothetical protein [Saprospiraceae bacterium]
MIIRHIPYLLFYWIATIAMVGVIACRPHLDKDLSVALEGVPEEVDFNIHIKPLLSDRCFKCHGPDANKREAGLRLDIRDSAYSQLPEHPGHYAIKPGNLRRSEVFHRILSSDPDDKMPPPKSNVSLTNREKALLIRWMEQG